VGYLRHHPRVNSVGYLNDFLTSGEPLWIVDTESGPFGGRHRLDVLANLRRARLRKNKDGTRVFPNWKEFWVGTWRDYSVGLPFGVERVILVNRVSADQAPVK
jgi:hypothetical protein